MTLAATTGGERMCIRDESDVFAARRTVRRVAAQHGLSPTAVDALATAVTEVARNIVVYAGSGDLWCGLLRDSSRRGVVVIARDGGPGIVDIARAMQDGYSTGSGLGLGLPGAKRLVDEFEIESQVGGGTTVTLCKWTCSE